MLIRVMYPFSQAYQIAEDRRRGDVTFAVRYGTKGIKRSYLTLFLPGILLLSYSLKFSLSLALLSLLGGLIAYFLIWQTVKNMTGNKNEYRKVMRTKYLGGLAFTAIVLIFLVTL